MSVTRFHGVDDGAHEVIESGLFLEEGTSPLTHALCFLGSFQHAFDRTP